MLKKSLLHSFLVIGGLTLVCGCSKGNPASVVTPPKGAVAATNSDGKEGQMPIPTDAGTDTPTLKPTDAADTDTPTPADADTGTPTPEPTATKKPEPTATNTPAPTTASTAESHGIEVDEKNFPDENFRAYISKYFDTDNDKKLSEEEIAAVLYIYPKSVSGEEERSLFKDFKAIRDFTGIEYFKELREFVLNTKGIIKKLPLNNAKLERLEAGIYLMDGEEIGEFSLQNASELTYLEMSGNATWQIDWGKMRKLQYLHARRVPVSLAEIANNTSLEKIAISEGYLSKGYVDKVDFSAMTGLKDFRLSLREEPGEKIAGTLSFAGNAKLEFVDICRGLADELVLPFQDITMVRVSGEGRDYKITFAGGKELPVLAEGDILLDEEHFPDLAFRQFIFLTADKNKDYVLSKEEREAVTKIKNDCYDFDKDARWNEGHANSYTREEETANSYAVNIRSLKGIENFPNLYSVQMNNIIVEQEELVLDCPNLKYFSLGIVQGKSKKKPATVDLSACSALTVCRFYDMGWEEGDAQVHIILPSELEGNNAAIEYDNVFWNCITE